jgi:uncharacterized protein YbjT (DUF2867 family)
MIILVAGATGQIARPAVRTLAAMGVPTRSLVRDRQRAAKTLLAADDACSTELVELQVGNRAQIADAFIGVNQVLLSMAERDSSGR